MTESLLDYLVKRNPTVIAPADSAPGGPTFTFSEDWDTIEDVEEWSEFNRMEEDCLELISMATKLNGLHWKEGLAAV